MSDTPTTMRLAMFPLGAPLLPGATVQLRVFEPRYRTMIGDLLSADTPGDKVGHLELGIVMIERGSEVGGGDVRTSVGCRARIVDLRSTAGGGYSVVVLGTQRVRVAEWLPDDPYPVALVEDWPDQRGAGSADASIGALIERVVALLVDMGAHGELPPDATPPSSAALAGRLSDNVTLAIYQLAALAPFGPADRAKLLAAPGLTDRLAVFDEALADAEAAARFRRS
jgi:Lon protease-like protein